MSSTDTAPTRIISDDTLAGTALNFAAITLGWFPAIFLGDAIGQGVPSAFFVTVLAYAAIVAGAQIASKRLF